MIHLHSFKFPLNVALVLFYVPICIHLFYKHWVNVSTFQMFQPKYMLALCCRSCFLKNTNFVNVNFTKTKKQNAGNFVAEIMFLVIFM